MTPMVREVVSNGWRARLDLREHVISFEVPEESYAYPADLIPVPPSGDGEPISAATLLLKAKQFDDGLLAAIELAAQAGLGRFPSKASLLVTLAGVLADHPAAVPVLAACQVGNVPVTVPDALVQNVRRAVDEFLRDGALSKPIGFYRWAPELEAIFRQDRFLQQPLAPDTADAVLSALDAAPALRGAHDAVLRLAARLTNPPMRPGLRATGVERAFIAPARSHEVRLFEKMYGDKPIPPGFDLMSELVRRVRSGAVRLEPTADSGWYDHQTWSLESLLQIPRTPEGLRHVYGPRYRKHLEDLFRAFLALARETHVKMGGGGRGGYGGPRVQPIRVWPALSVEPTPTTYARRAAAYRFVRGVLDEAFGPDWKYLHRLSAEGPRVMTLGEELTRMERIFDGAAVVSSQELGLDPIIGSTEAAGGFTAWRAVLSSDRDVAQDARMMVPVFYDIQRRKTKVWALLGWRTVRATAEYRNPPTVLGVEPVAPPAQTPPPDVEFTAAGYQFAVPVVAEVYVTRLLDRDEFRRHCDQYRTPGDIIRNLP